MAPARRNLVSFLDDLARAPRRVAYVRRTAYRSFSWTAGEVHTAALAVSDWLGANGVRAGDRVILRGPNAPEWCAAFFGILARGAVAVPLDESASAERVRGVAERVAAAAAVGAGADGALAAAPRVLPLERIRTLPSSAGEPYVHRADREETSQIVFTSGTTGEPRGVELSHANLLASLERIEAGFVKRERWLAPLLPMRFLCTVPLSHLFGQSLGLFVPVILRSTGVFVSGVQPSRILKTIRAERPLAVIAVPRTLQGLRECVERELERRGRLARFVRLRRRLRGDSAWRRAWSARDLRAVIGWRTWVIVSGGAPLDAALESFWVDSGFFLIQGYGMTEAAPIVSVHNPLRGGRRTLGRPVGGVEVRLADDGEVLVRGPNVMKGYWRDPEATRETLHDGWLRTGDLAERDDDGRLRYLGRKKDVIVTASGMNVHPDDVEHVLDSLEGVRESAVFGVSEAGGETVHAAVLTSRPSVDPENLRAAANDRLESHQRLRRVIVWPDADFPRTSTGKVRRVELAAAARTAAPARAADTGAAAVGEVLRRVRADVAGGREPGDAQDAPLDLDSLETVELLGRLEEEYGVAVDDRAVDGPLRVGDLERLVAGTAAESVEVAMPRWSRRLPARAARAVLRTLVVGPAFRLFVRLEVRGREHLESVDRPCLFVANHTSVLDAPAILLALPGRLRRRLSPAMAIETLPEHFDPHGRRTASRVRASLLYKLAVLVFHAYPLPQARAFRPSLEYTGELIDAGFCPLVFPEGRMTRTGRMDRFKAGIGLLAIETGAPVVPVRLDGLGEILPPSARWPRRGTARVRVGAAVDPLEGGAAAPAAVAERIERAVRRLGDHVPAAGRLDT